MARGEVSAARIISSAVPLLSVLVTVEGRQLVSAVILRGLVTCEMMYLHWPLSSAVYNGMLAERGLIAPDLEQHQTLGKLRTSDYQQKSKVGEI